MVSHSKCHVAPELQAEKACYTSYSSYSLSFMRC